MADKENERWQDLCEQAAKEQDPKKLMEIVREINDLLDAKRKRHDSNSSSKSE
jgi:hypothetical protein